MDEAELVEQITGLVTAVLQSCGAGLSALIWPAVVVFALKKFHGPLTRALERLTDRVRSLEAPGTKLAFEEGVKVAVAVQEARKAEAEEAPAVAGEPTSAGGDSAEPEAQPDASPRVSQEVEGPAVPDGDGEPSQPDHEAPTEPREEGVRLTRLDKWRREHRGVLESEERSGFAMAAARARASGAILQHAALRDALHLTRMNTTAAVLLAFTEVEMRLRSLVDKAGLKPANTAARAIAALRQANVIDEGEAALADRLLELRNMAAHGGSPSELSALDYIRLASDVASQLDVRLQKGYFRSPPQRVRSFERERINYRALVGSPLVVHSDGRVWVVRNKRILTRFDVTVGQRLTIRISETTHEDDEASRYDLFLDGKLVWLNKRGEDYDLVFHARRATDDEEEEEES